MRLVGYLKKKNMMSSTSRRREEEYEGMEEEEQGGGEGGSRGGRRYVDTPSDLDVLPGHVQGLFFVLLRGKKH